ncbi:PspC domain-containing protein [Glutamicibacter creatinolyticus]|uniref:ATP-binding protein n=1 Tax=Glutamicibacter creatinolyticus TaxID=162496 RepID=UPI0037BEAC6D
METPEQPRRIVRSESRLLAGVCAGLAEHLNLPVSYVRLGFLLLTAIGGIGAVLYAWLWVFTPSSQESQADEQRSTGTRRRSLAEELGLDAPGSLNPREVALKLGSMREVLVGVVLTVLALLALGQWLGWNIRWDLIWPSIGIVAGVLLAWLQIDGRGGPQATRKERAGALSRLVVGLLLVIGGLLLIVNGTVSTSDLIGGIWAALAIFGGALVVLLPFGTRLWRDYLAERSSRQAAAQRAEFAAHLHDSVLQTLAVIQKRAGDPAAVRALARSQERELRQWLYGDEDVSEGDVAAEISQEAAQIEQLMLREVDVVSVGSAQGFEGQHALVQASREAMMNAAKHATGLISVFIECGEQAVEVFIRDRGDGFDPQDIDPDRQGVRESILGRMERAGGEAKIRSGEQGTEIQLKMPRTTAGKANHHD